MQKRLLLTLLLLIPSPKSLADNAVKKNYKFTRTAAEKKQITLKKQRASKKNKIQEPEVALINNPNPGMNDQNASLDLKDDPMWRHKEHEPKYVSFDFAGTT